MFVSKYPVTVTSLSLEKRLKPRIDAVIAEGLDPGTLSVGPMMKKTDDEFDVWLENRKKEHVRKDQARG